MTRAVDLTARDLRVYVAAHLNAELAGSLVVPDALTIIQKLDVGGLYALLPSIRIKYLDKLCGRLHLQSDGSLHPHAPGICKVERQMLDAISGPKNSETRGRDIQRTLKCTSPEFWSLTTMLMTLLATSGFTLTSSVASPIAPGEYGGCLITGKVATST